MVASILADTLTDLVIWKYVDTHGPRWKALATSLGGRTEGWTGDVVRHRHARLLRRLTRDGMTQPPSCGTPPPKTKSKRKPAKSRATFLGDRNFWTQAEDDALTASLKKGGASWHEIASRLGRTAQAARNRAERLGI